MVQGPYLSMYHWHHQDSIITVAHLHNCDTYSMERQTFSTSNTIRYGVVVNIPRFQAFRFKIETVKDPWSPGFNSPYRSFFLLISTLFPRVISNPLFAAISENEDL